MWPFATFSSRSCKGDQVKGEDPPSDNRISSSDLGRPRNSGRRIGNRLGAGRNDREGLLVGEIGLAGYGPPASAEQVTTNQEERVTDPGGVPIVSVSWHDAREVGVRKLANRGNFSSSFNASWWAGNVQRTGTVYHASGFA